MFLANVGHELCDNQTTHQNKASSIRFFSTLQEFYDLLHDKRRQNIYQLAESTNHVRHRVLPFECLHYCYNQILLFLRFVNLFQEF